MSTDILPHLLAVVPVATASFVWVLYGETHLAVIASRACHHHFPAQPGPEVILQCKPRPSPVTVIICQHSLNQRKIVYTAEHILFRILHLQ